jgi:hypothetical protein
MKCAICYEKFFTPETEEECKKIYNEFVKNDDYNEIMKFYNLVVTPKHNNTHTCSTPNCGCLICGDCWTKITHNGKDIMDATVDDIPSIYDYFTCPYCRNIDWKDYMINVFNELQQKVLGKEEFKELFFKKCFSEFDK